MVYFQLQLSIIYPSMNELLPIILTSYLRRSWPIQRCTTAHVSAHKRRSLNVNRLMLTIDWSNVIYMPMPTGNQRWRYSITRTVIIIEVSCLQRESDCTTTAVTYLGFAIMMVTCFFNNCLLAERAFFNAIRCT